MLRVIVRMYEVEESEVRWDIVLTLSPEQIANMAKAVDALRACEGIAMEMTSFDATCVELSDAQRALLVSYESPFGPSAAVKPPPMVRYDGEGQCVPGVFFEDESLHVAVSGEVTVVITDEDGDVFEGYAGTVAEMVAA